KLIAHADFEQWLVGAAGQALSRKTIVQWFYELKGDDTDAALPVPEVKRVLRRLRERVFFTAMVRDLNQTAPVQEVVGAMSALADLAVAEAYKSVAASLAEVHGIPIDPNTGKPQELLIVGMGKLGGKEL